MATLTHKISVFADGSLSASLLPAGYFLAQIGEYQTAPSGNPAVIPLRDSPDTIFNEQWQLSMYAHNFGMAKNNVADLMGNQKAFMNGTGVGDPNNPRANFITEEDMNADLPRLKKLITCALNTHAVRDYDDTHYQVWTMDGTKDPLMIAGATKPTSVDDIDSGRVKSSDYVYSPFKSLFAFVVPNNFNTKPGNLTTISPFPNGLQYPWTPEPDEIYQFFPLVSMKPEPVLSEKSLWRRVTTYPPYYRRL